MNHILTEKFATALPALRPPIPEPRFRRRGDDALDPVRGILVGALLSVLVFWLPLALTLTG